MFEKNYTTQSETETDQIGKELAQLIPPQAVIALEGTLGAGKTRLVQAIADAWGIPRRQVVSPTFVLVQEYEGERKVYHIDAYRLRDEDEFLELGVEEMFSSKAVVFIEWAEKFESLLPADHATIEIDVLGETERQIAVRLPFLRA